MVAYQIESKSILNKSKKRDPWFLGDYTISPYSGCSFNCLYCYIRGSKYGLHMEDKLAVKSNAVELLEKQLALRARKNQYGIIVLSSSTDPYLQIEKDQLLTRQLLEIILKYRFPLHIITKSDLVVRDFDLLHAIRERAILPADLAGNLQHGLFITFSFSTLDSSIGKIFEPGATAPPDRLIAMKQALQNGFHSGVSLMPLLPYITDTAEHLETMFSVFHNVGVNYIFPASITLFGTEAHDSRTLVMKAIEKHYPQLLEKYRSLFAQGYQVPHSYSKVLSQKTKDLSLKYGLKNSII